MIRAECLPTILIGFPDGAQSEQDAAAFVRAEKHCKDLYGPEECLKEFRKTGPGSYKAICKKE